MLHLVVQGFVLFAERRQSFHGEIIFAAGLFGIGEPAKSQEKVIPKNSCMSQVKPPPVRAFNRHTSSARVNSTRNSSRRTHSMPIGFASRGVRRQTRFRVLSVVLPKVFAGFSHVRSGATAASHFLDQRGKALNCVP